MSLLRIALPQAFVADIRSRYHLCLRDKSAVRGMLYCGIPSKNLTGFSHSMSCIDTLTLSTHLTSSVQLFFPDSKELSSLEGLDDWRSPCKLSGCTLHVMKGIHNRKHSITSTLAFSMGLFDT